MNNHGDSVAPPVILVAIHGERSSGRTLDIRLTGCQLEASSSLSQGSLVRPCIKRNEQTVETMATVVGVQLEQLAFAFLETVPEQGATSVRSIAEMNAEHSTQQVNQTGTDHRLP